MCFSDVHEDAVCSFIIYRVMASVQFEYKTTHTYLLNYYWTPNEGTVLQVARKCCNYNMKPARLPMSYTENVSLLG